MLLQRFYQPAVTDFSTWASQSQLKDLIRQFDHAFNQGDVQKHGLPLDITETDNAYNVVAYVPRIDAKSLEVMIRDRKLYIKASRPEPEQSKQSQVVLSELPYGVFERWIHFEKDISSDAKASLKDGLLTLTIPKQQVQQSIPIQVETSE
jgi:HSP20 family molecular chaperone IbpA